MIVLFDLDGTVLTFRDSPPGPGRAAMDAAMRALFGVERASEGMRFSGGTDAAIVRALLVRCGVAPNAIDAATIDRAIEVYLRCLDEELSRRRYHAIGDVRAGVDACSAMGFCIGVATGNVREGARRKLRSAELEGVFDLDRGGYGCDAEPRPEILRAALRRCGWREAGADEVFVIGDTANDVAAARAIGAKAIGVAHERHAREELMAAGAEAIVDDCGAAVAEAIRAHRRARQ